MQRFVSGYAFRHSAKGHQALRLQALFSKLKPSLILGGAALQRCVKPPIIESALAAEVKQHSSLVPRHLTPQPHVSNPLLVTCHHHLSSLGDGGSIVAACSAHPP